MWVQKIGIPTYFRRGEDGNADWERAAKAKPDLGITVINPNSGPGYTSPFQPGGEEHRLCGLRIEEMHRAGAAVVGYVTTNYHDKERVQREHRFTVDSATDVVTTRWTSDEGGGEKETGWTTGFGPVQVGSASTLPGGLAAGRDYFWIELSPHTGHFALSEADALNNIPVDVTSPGDPGPENENHFTGLSRSPENVDNVRFEIDEFYRRWPQIDGMFFDEMDDSTDDAILAYYRQIHSHVKTKPGKALVVQNPGKRFPEELLGVADVFMSFEGTPGTYQEHTLGWEGGHAPERFWHAIHSCTEPDMPGIIARSRTLNAGYVYVTDGSVNRWLHIAAYFEQETQAVRAGNTPN